MTSVPAPAHRLAVLIHVHPDAGREERINSQEDLISRANPGNHSRGWDRAQAEQLAVLDFNEFITQLAASHGITYADPVVIYWGRFEDDALLAALLGRFEGAGISVSAFRWTEEFVPGIGSWQQVIDR